MTTIDRNGARQVAAEIDAAIAPILAAHGLSVDTRRVQFGEHFRFNITALPSGTDRGAEAFDKYANVYGLGEVAIGTTLTVRGTIYRIVGLEPSRRKYPVKVERVADGKPFLLTIAAVKAAVAVSA